MSSAVEQALTKMQQARIGLIIKQPFFGVLALRLKLRVDETCPTGWTDGRHLGFNPKFVNDCTRDQLLFFVAHEVMHCAAGHPWRRDQRQPFKWNVAADYAINHVLAEARFALIPHVLHDAKYAGKSAEWIYNRLPVPPQQRGGGQGQGSSGSGSGQGQPMPGAGAEDVRDAPRSQANSGDGHPQQQDGGDGSAAGGGDCTEADWQQAVAQAATAAKAAGKLPASLERYVQAATQPRVDWRSVLRRFVQQAARADYTWRLPSQRYCASGLYLPSLHTEQMGPLAVVVDTSGSIDATTLSAFAAEINAIVSEVRPERTYVIYCDAKVHRVDVFEPEDALAGVQLRAVGGGGTAFGPALDAAEQLDDEPVCLIYLTDLYGPHRNTAPPFPVLWACTSGEQDVPYGEVVSMEHV